MSMLPPLVLELRAKANEVYTEMAGVTGAVDKMEKQTGSSMGRVERSFNKAAGAGKILGAGILIAGGIVAVESLKMATHFQSKMTLLQTAAGESGKNMKLVSDGILNLAGSTGTSVEQLSEGMYTVEKSGNRGADGLKILKAAAQGAKAENVDLGVATNALTSVMMSYNKKAKDAVSVQNEMIAGSGMAKTTMQEYAGSLSSVLPVASSAGISFAQVAGAIATLTQHGTSAQESTQELANTIRSLQAPNQVAQHAMSQLGLSVTDVSKNLGKRGLTGTIEVITNAIAAKMGPSGLVVVDTMKKSSAAAADARTMLGKLPASMQDVAKGFMNGTITQKQWRHEIAGMSVDHRQLAQQFASTVNQSRGFNDLLKSGSPAAQTFAGTLNKVMGGATGMNTALMLGGANMSYFKSATEEVGKAGRKTGSDISTWQKTQATLAVQLAQVGHGIEAMGIRLGTILIPFVQRAIKAGTGFVNWLVQNPPLMITFGSIIGGFLVLMIGAYIAKITLAAVESLKSFAKMIAAGFAWAAKTAGTVARVIAIYVYAFASWLAETVASLAESTALWAMYFGEWLAKTAATVAESVAFWAVYFAQWVARTAAAAATWVATQAAAFAAMIAKGAAWVAASTAQLAAWLAKNAVVAAQGLILWVRYGAMMAVQLVGMAAKWVASAAASVAAMVAQNAAMLLQKAIVIGGAVAMGIATAAQWAWNIAMDANPIGLIILAIAALIGIIILVVTHWKEFSAFLIGAWKNIASFFVSVGRGIASWWNGFWNGIVSFARTVFTNYVHGIVAIFRFLWTAYVAVGNALRGWWNGLWNGIVSFARTIFTGYIHAAVAIFRFLQGAFAAVGSALRGWWNGLWNGIVAFARGVFTGYVSFVVGAFRSIVGFFSSIGGTISRVWNSIWSGLGAIVRSAFAGVISFVQGVVNNIIGLINGIINGINTVSSMAGAVGVKIAKIPKVPGMATGGATPGAPGEPSLAVVHGGEWMLSADMLAGRTPVPQRVVQNLQTGTAAAAAAWAGRPGGRSERGGDRSVTVNAYTNASAGTIAGKASWELRRRG